MRKSDLYSAKYGLELGHRLFKSQASVSPKRFGAPLLHIKCGGSLDMWEGSGWISPIDPYGWFQWYCRFYLGRRSTDDERQIKRGMGVAGVKGRFRNQLIGKCSQAGTLSVLRLPTEPLLGKP